MGIIQSKRSKGKEVEESPRIATPSLPPSRYQLYCTDLFEKEKVLEKINISDSRLNDALHKFDGNEISAAVLADELIHALFNRDFSGNGAHWSDDGTRVQPWKPPADEAKLSERREKILSLGFTDPEGVEAFVCEESSTWDWKDIYAVAKSSGTVIISRSELRIVVMDYKFYCSG